MRLFMQIILVAFGSALGGLARWGVSSVFVRMFGHYFPWGTLFINLTGSLFLGWFATVIADRLTYVGSPRLLAPDDLRLMVAVGFTGAYTTFSTFEFEAHKMLGDKDYFAAAAYVAGSVFLGLAAVRAGTMLAR